MFMSSSCEKVLARASSMECQAGLLKAFTEIFWEYVILLTSLTVKWIRYVESLDDRPGDETDAV